MLDPQSHGRLHHLVKQAYGYSDTDADIWMNTPNPMFRGYRPRDCQYDDVIRVVESRRRSAERY